MFSTTKQTVCSSCILFLLPYKELIISNRLRRGIRKEVIYIWPTKLFDNIRDTPNIRCDHVVLTKEWFFLWQARYSNWHNFSQNTSLLTLLTIQKIYHNCLKSYENLWLCFEYFSWVQKTVQNRYPTLDKKNLEEWIFCCHNVTLLPGSNLFIFFVPFIPLFAAFSLFYHCIFCIFLYLIWSDLLLCALSLHL